MDVMEMFSSFMDTNRMDFLSLCVSLVDSDVITTYSDAFMENDTAIVVVPSRDSPSDTPYLIHTQNHEKRNSEEVWNRSERDIVPETMSNGKFAWTTDDPDILESASFTDLRYPSENGLTHLSNDYDSRFSQYEDETVDRAPQLLSRSTRKSKSPSKRSRHSSPKVSRSPPSTQNPSSPVRELLDHAYAHYTLAREAHTKARKYSRPDSIAYDEL